MTMKWAEALRYTVMLESQGNPDFRQYAPISERLELQSASLESIVGTARAYIDFWDLGNGNWVEPEVRDHDKGGASIGVIEYRGGGKLVQSYRVTCKACAFVAQSARFPQAFESAQTHTKLKNGHEYNFDRVYVDVDDDLVETHQARAFDMLMKEGD